MTGDYPSCRATYTHEELAEHFLLSPAERALVDTCCGDVNRHGMAVLLKDVQYLGYFPDDLQQVPEAVRPFMAHQLQLLWDLTEHYPWRSGRHDAHLALIRQHMGFRYPTGQDNRELETWLQTLQAQDSPTAEALHACAVARLRRLGIELPAEQELQRIVRSALHGFFQDLYARVTAQLSETTRANLDQLLVVAPGASQSTFDQLKAEPSAPGVKNLQKEVTKLQTRRAQGVFAESLAGIPFKVLQTLRRHAHQEHASEMRAHPAPIRYALLACFVHARTMDVTDDAVRMLLEVVRRIETQTEKRLHREPLQDIKRVAGKVQLLFRVAEAVVDAPEGAIRDVIFPRVRIDIGKPCWDRLSRPVMVIMDLRHIPTTRVDKATFQQIRAMSRRHTMRCTELSPGGCRGLRAVLLLAVLAALTPLGAFAQNDKPNILVIWGDDIGIPQISAYTRGLMGYQTPNIDRIAHEGMLFTDAYGQQSCTAGRASFILGQEPFRTGLLTIGMPGDPHGITAWMPTIADVLKDQGYATGQFGKNHLGDQDAHLPTNHGFDEFFGNLYHLNAEEEPEGYFYPKDPEFRKKYGPRGVIQSAADGNITDTGPLSTKRMETVDEEFLAAAKDFIERQAQAAKPFFVWFNTTRMHVFTHLKPASYGKTGKGIHADGMVEHDGHVGQLLDLLDTLKIAENTIVIYSTDNGAEIALWPDGAMTQFRSEKGTTWEGGFRVPMMVRWPGVIKPGSVSNEIISNIDWFPTLVAAASGPDIKEQMAKGMTANGKPFKVHLDGYNFLPYLKGEQQQGPRDRIMYFDQAGNLNAIRWNDWKLNFAMNRGNIAEGSRETTNWAMITNLRMDPYERAMEEGGGYLTWYAQQIWLLVPIQQVIKDFFADFDEYPYQTGSSLNAANINYGMLQREDALKRLKNLETLKPR